MTEQNEEIEFLPFEVAQRVVGAVMEEEHLHDSERRILTVYDLKDRELCWFDADEIMAELVAKEGALPKNPDELKRLAVELVLHQIPAWALKEPPPAEA
ncbi:MAG: hypothetical protein U5J62_10920 [Desulfurivibrio sp.]|nr:hypothetical protein [Desulfurivibrio sp.]